jgi:hypothetical protein
MAGSARRFFRDTTPEQLRDLIRAEEEKTTNQEFDRKVSSALADLLANFNRRDTVAIQNALSEITRCLSAEIEGDLEPMLGGSVRKHTYVDGISDIDSLVILNDESLQAKSPQEVLDYFEKRLRQQLSDWEVSPHGNLAVTLRKGGLELQLLPATRQEDRIAIPSPSGTEWARIDPQRFYDKLSRTNSALGMKLVPMIKLAKAINDTLPESGRLSGYHIESIAIEAFRDYAGPVNPKAMLKHFYDKARGIVLSPIRDSSGQSVHVDEYLGGANAESRRVASASLDRVYRQMRNADGLGSVEQWLRLFGEDL